MAHRAGGLLLSSAQGEPLGWLHRGRKHLPGSRVCCASPSFLQMEAGEKEPALRPRAPPFSKQTGRKMKPQEALCFWKMIKEANRQVLLFSKYCKILTWPLGHDFFVYVKPDEKWVYNNFTH